MDETAAVSSRSVVVRPAEPRDAGRLAAIYRPAVNEGTSTFELEPPDEAEMARRLLAITGAGYPYFVAEVEGAVAGSCYANAFRARPAYRFTVEDSIYIDPSCFGRGLGTLLLHRLVAAAAGCGFRQMVAVIGDSPAQAASVALHARCGFEVVGRLPGVGYKHGRWLDTLLMQRALGAGDAAPPAAA
jgi:phosphinothricin acetyltransferase